MKVQTYLSAAEAEAAEISGSAAVVIDVIRATSTIVAALASGARAIYPTVSMEEAIRLATSLGREDTLLCGERKGLKISGFDLGNSPGEFTPERVGGMRLVMSTTNGTRAFAAGQDAERVIAASFLNLSAVVESLRDEDEVVLICAGKEGRFALDDAVCAGAIVRALVGSASGNGADAEDGDTVEEEEGDAVKLDDASRAVLTLAGTHRPEVGFLAGTAAGSALVKVGLGADLEHCARLDQHDLVPEMRDRMIQLSGGAS